MAASIISQDIIGICLYLLDGNIELELSELFHRIEKFQENHNRHFGLSRNDFRGLFRALISLELGFMNFSENIGEIRFRNIISQVLKYHNAYFNDEGEHWDKYNIKINKLSMQEHEKYRNKLRTKRLMQNFFKKNNDEYSIVCVKEFMQQLGLSIDLLYRCSRPGKSS